MITWLGIVNLFQTFEDDSPMSKRDIAAIRKLIEDGGKENK